MSIKMFESFIFYAHRHAHMRASALYFPKTSEGREVPYSCSARTVSSQP